MLRGSPFHSGTDTIESQPGVLVYLFEILKSKTAHPRRNDVTMALFVTYEVMINQKRHGNNSENKCSECGFLSDDITSSENILKR